MRLFAGLLLAVVPAAAAGSGPGLPLFFIQDSPSRYVVAVPSVHACFDRTGVEFGAPRDSVHVRFAGVRADARIEPAGEMGPVSVLTGAEESQWRRRLSSFRELRYHGLYPGIDLVYAADARGRLKAEFHVAPGADPRLIRLEYSAEVTIGEDGVLHAGALSEQAPEIFQAAAQGTVAVPGRFRLLGPKAAGFEIGPYDRTKPLIIDPVISYSTYLGGSGMGAVTGVAVDSGGNLYAAGWTEALNFPIVAPVQAANQGGVDVFVVKLSPSGNSLLYATYIGGQGDDRAAAIAVDSSGLAYVTGSTTSTNFPLVNAYQVAKGGSKTAFAFKLGAFGYQLQYSTYLGGANYETGNAIAVDGSGNAYIAGDTQSANFPVLNAAQASIGGGADAFVAKLNAAGSLAFSTFLGGSADEHAGGIAVDSSGAMYIAGGTYSTNFPVVNAVQSTPGGGQDAFVAKLPPSGAPIAYSTYLGGSSGGSPEQANGIAVDASGNAYIAGVTNSANFPVTAGAYQTLFGGVSEAFVTKLNAFGNGLVFSTYVGGSSFDWAAGIGLDSSNRVYVTGYTSSADFPRVNAVQSAFGGLYDAFLCELNAAGNGVLFSTYFGGSGSDVANALAVDASGNMFIGGQTSSTDLPLTGALQTSNLGGSTGWLARVGVTAPPVQTPSVVSVSPASGSGNTVTFTAQYADTGGAAALSSVSLLVNTTASLSYGCAITYNPAANVFTLANDTNTGSFTVTPGGGSQQNSQCALNGLGSSAASSGSTLTVTVSLTFLPGFSGTKSVYLYAADSGSNTGWVSEGSWTVTIPPPQPSANTVSPNASSGSSQTFTFVFSDTQSASNLTGMAMLFAPSLTFTNACYVVYDWNAGTLALVWDNGLGSDSRPLGSSTVLQNSQCQIGAFSTAISGLSEILTINITFKGPFSGAKNIYMYASEGSLNTGWVQRGTYTVTAGGLPTAVSVIPGSGSGPGQRFSFTISDPGGSSYLTGLAALFSTSLSTANACSLVYDRASNTVSLAYDNPANGATPVVPGSAAVASNSQCTLKGANTTVVIGTNSIVLTADLSFNASWFGSKNIYLLASETTVNSGWVTVGAWTVTGGAPTADSVTPSSGSGNSPSFTFTVSDSSFAGNISGMSMLLTSGAPSNIANACYLVYDRAASTIGLYDDGGTVLSTKALGSSATLQNSQCAVGYTVMYVSGNSVLFSINLLLKSGTFSGSKAVYLQAIEPTSSSGWVQRGSWSVP
jgi:hypothetical protein